MVSFLVIWINFAFKFESQALLLKVLGLLLL